jgi:hypothetical protein
MAASAQIQANKPAGHWRWIGGIALLLIVAITILCIVVYRAEPMLRAAVIETLSTRFKNKVELDAFHVSPLKGLQVSGAGLRIFGETDPNNYEPGVQPIVNQPIIKVAEFRFHMGIRDLFRSPMHVDTVYVKGLQLNLPPREHRSEMNNIAPKGGKIEIIVDRLVCDNAQLIVNTLRPGKLPLEFDIENLKMTRIGPDSPPAFRCNLDQPQARRTDPFQWIIWPLAARQPARYSGERDLFVRPCRLGHDHGARWNPLVDWQVRRYSRQHCRGWRN